MNDATLNAATQTPAKAAARHSLAPLPSPAVLRQRLPLSAALAARVEDDRAQIRAVLAGRDERLLVVVGPCSLHDPLAALEYAERLAELRPQVEDQLLLVMRTYIEKPRTTVGWKGLLYDPHLDGSGDMAEGLRLSRQLMIEVLERGLPIASELLQPMAAGYFDDLLGWAAIGARTSESQVHREMVSGLDMPVGFKNGTDGSLAIACDGVTALNADRGRRSRAVRLGIGMGIGIGMSRADCRLDRPAEGSSRPVARVRLLHSAPLPDRWTDEQHRDGEQPKPSAHCPSVGLQAPTPFQA